MCGRRVALRGSQGPPWTPCQQGGVGTPGGDGRAEMMDSAGAPAGPGWSTLGEQRLDGKEIAMHLARCGGTGDERSIFPASRLSNPLAVCERFETLMGEAVRRLLSPCFLWDVGKDQWLAKNQLAKFRWRSRTSLSNRQRECVFRTLVFRLC